MTILLVGLSISLSQIDLELCCLKVHQGVPLMYVPREVVMSKYYGESERLMGKVFSLANELPNGAILFLDKVDSFAIAPVVKRMKLPEEFYLLYCDSRFDSMITFGLPDHWNHQEIAAQYAKHLTKSELVELAAATEVMSGRDIRDVYQEAERSWALKIIRGQASKDGKEGCLPLLQEYIESATNRRKTLLDAAEQSRQISNNRTKRQPLDLCCLHWTHACWI